MRVGLLIYDSLDTVSGGYLYDRKLVEYLRRQGDDVSIISLPWRNYVRHLCDNFSLSLLRHLERAPLDVLIEDELNHPSLVLLNRRLRAQLKCPIISIVHNLRSSEARPAWQQALYRRIEHHYLAGVDGFVFNSQATRTAVEGLVGGNCHAVVACPAGDRLRPDLSETDIAARAQRPGPLRIIFLANVIPGKGLHTLVSALEQLPREEFGLRIAGSITTDRAYVRSIREQVARGGLSERVELLGQLSADDLIPELQQSHVLAVPSLYEGFGIAYLEGMGFGLPAIASTAGGAREIITHNKDGFLVTPGDTVGLATRLRSLSRDRQRLLEMSLNAHRRYLAHPTWDMTTAAIRLFLQNVIVTASSQTKNGWPKRTWYTGNQHP